MGEDGDGGTGGRVLLFLFQEGISGGGIVGILRLSEASAVTAREASR